MRIRTVLALAMAPAMIGLSHPAIAHPPGELGAVIDRLLRADGPFFTPAEQEVINRACGYAPGEWDGFQANISNGTLICRNGRRADGPEARRVVQAAEPRIRARVNRVMADPQVTTAIARVAEHARARAMRAVRAAWNSGD